MIKLSFNEWKKLASKISFPNKAFINGKYVDSISGKIFESINPANGEVLTSVSECSEQDVDMAVNAARKSFEKGDWSTMPPAERKGVLLKLADLIRANLNEFALLDSLDMGKLVNDAVTIDAPGSAMFFQWHAEAIDKMYDEIAPTGPGDLAMVARKPLGVIGAVVPWNFPLDMAALNASKIAHCRNDGKSNILHFLFDNQHAWVKGETIDEFNSNLEELTNKEKFGINVKKCLDNKKIEDHILEDRIDGVKKFKVNSTPTIIINDKKFEKPLNYKNLKKSIEKLI